jgi:hypothetical protein
VSPMQQQETNDGPQSHQDMQSQILRLLATRHSSGFDEVRHCQSGAGCHANGVTMPVVRPQWRGAALATSKKGGSWAHLNFIYVARALQWRLQARSALLIVRVCSATSWNGLCAGSVVHSGQACSAKARYSDSPTPPCPGPLACNQLISCF